VNEGHTDVFTGVQPVESDGADNAADTSTNNVSMIESSRRWMAYKIPRLRPHATVIFSLRFMLSSQMTNHGRIAKQKSATTNQAIHISDTQNRQAARNSHPTVNPTLEKSIQHVPGTRRSQVLCTGSHCTTTTILENSVINTVPARKAQMKAFWNLFRTMRSKKIPTAHFPRPITINPATWL
jgi:hypothetical protein